VKTDSYFSCERSGAVRQLLKPTAINKSKNKWTKNSFLAREHSSKEKEKLPHSQIFTIHRERRVARNQVQEKLKREREYYL
jgi:hypothetical protein